MDIHQGREVMSARIAKQDQLLKEHVNVLDVYDEQLLIDKSNQLISVFECAGLNVTAMDGAQLDNQKIARNRFFKDLEGQYACYHWVVRERVSPELAGDFKQHGALQYIHEAYANKLK